MCLAVMYNWLTRGHSARACGLSTNVPVFSAPAGAAPTILQHLTRLLCRVPAVVLAFTLLSPQSLLAQSPPAQPQHFTVGVSKQIGAGSNTTGQAQLNWANPADSSITKYQVRHKAGTGFTPSSDDNLWTDISGSNSFSTFVFVQNLTFGTTYVFQVRAVNADGNGTPSPALTAAPTPLPVPQGFSGQFLHPPTNVVVTTPDFGKIKVTWDWYDPTCSSIQGEPYIFEVVYRKPSVSWNTVSKGTDSGKYTHYYNHSNNTYITEWEFPRLGSRGQPDVVLDSEEYEVSVTYAGGQYLNIPDPNICNGYGSWASPISVIVQSDTNPDFGGATIPDQFYTQGTAITPLVLPEATGNGTLSYSMTPSLPAGLSFDAATRTLSGTPTTLQAATAYTYTATDAQGDTSSLTFNITVIALAKPANLTATPGNAQVTLSWDDPSDSTITKYQVRYAQGAADPTTATWTDIANSGATTTTHTVGNLTNGQVYAFQVRAVAGVAEGPASDTATATPIAAPAIQVAPATLVVDEDGSNTFDVTLATAPTAAVTVTVVSDDTDVTVSPTPLTFTTTNYSTAQTVTVNMAASPTDGAATITLTAAGGNYAGLTATVAVTANALPTFGTQTIADQTYPQGAQITTLNLPQASGGDGTLTYTLTPTPPAGLSFDATARTLTGTPTTAQAAIEYTYKVTDGDGDEAELKFDITITADSQPSFGSDTIADQTYLQNSAITQLDLPQATGGDAPLTYTLTPNLPDGLSFDATARTLTGTPTTAQAATEYTYKVVDNDGDEAELKFDITITADSQPDFGTQTIADQTYPQGTAITTLNLPQATGGDGTLAYTLTPTLPAGLTFDATARTLTGTPTAPQAATEYTYTATDADGDTATLTFDIRITPTLTLGGVADANLAENTAYTGTATLSGTPVGNITWALTGDDANANGFTLSNQSNTGATVTLGAKDFEVPTDNDTNNIYVYTLTATDDDSNIATVNVAITITNIDEPATLTLTGLADASVSENQAYTVDASLTGALGAVTWTLGGADAGAFTLPAADQSQTGARVSLAARDFETPTDSDTGNTYEYTLTATDANTNTVTSAVYTVTVTDVDEAPAKPTNLTAAAGDTEVMLNWTNPNDSTITKYQVRYAQGTADPTTATWTDIANSGATTTTHTVDNLTNGTTYAFQIRAVVGAVNGPDSDTVTATPTLAVPDAPTNLTATAGDTQVILNWTNPTNASTLDNLQVRYKATADLPFVNTDTWTNLAATATTYTATSLTNGTDYTFAVRATNTAGDGTAATVAATPTVNAPTFGAATIADQSWTRLVAITSVTLPQATGGNGTLSYALTPALPTGVSLDTTTRTVSGTPTVALAQTLYTWTATDAQGDAASLTFNITVAQGNRAPVVVRPIPDSGAWLNSPFGDDVFARRLEDAGEEIFSDADGDALTYTATSADTSVATATTNNVVPDGVASVEAQAVSVGTVEITLRATDPSGEWAEDNFNITVIDANGSGHMSSFNDVTISVNGGSTEYINPPLPAVASAATASSFSGLSLTATSANPSVATAEIINRVNGVRGPVFATFNVRVTAVGTGVTTVTVTADSSLAAAVTETFTVTVTGNLAPAQPANLQATPGDGEVALSWGNPSDSSITKYQVRYAQGTADPTTATWNDITGSGAATTSHTVDNLTNGTTYAFQVRAVSAQGDGATSDTVTATPLAKPAAPTGLTAAARDRAALLTWTDPSNTSISKYQVRHAAGTSVPANTAWTDIAGSTATTISHTVDNLTNGTQYAFELRAVNASGDGAAATVTATPTQPTVTLALSATAISENGGQATVTASLDYPSTGATTLTVAVAPATGSTAVPGDFTLSSPPTLMIAQGDTTSTGTVTVTGVDNTEDTADKDLTVSATAANPRGVTGPASLTLTLTDDDAPPAAPTGLTATAGDTQVTLNWTDPSNNAITKYQVRYGAGPTVPATATWEDITGSGATTTTHTVDNLTNGTQYAFEIRAVNATGNSDASATVTATPRPDPAITVAPDTLVVDEGGSNTFDVTLVAAPTAAVAITVASNNTNVTVNPTSLTFSATNYNTAQTVTVTMAANPLPNGNATLTLAATGGNYAGLTATVAVTANALPSFGAQTIADQTYPQGTAITTLNLPQATGGDGTLAYTLTPTPPAGLTFNATARTLTGTPTAPQAATEYTYTATDADGDTATLTFDIRITPTLTLGGVADANQAENTAYTGNATLTGTPVGNITWALTGDDANASGFTLSNQSNTGATVTLGAKDFEVPTDNDTNNIYVYTLTATDDDGNSDTVNVAITITNVDEAPAKPANLTAAPGDTEVTLTWTNPNDSTITKYQVRQAQGATIPATTAWNDIANSTAATTTHTVDNLTNGTTYAFQIRAVVGTANGPDSDTVTATPRPDPAITVAPDTLVVDEGGSNTFDVTLVAAPTAAVAITVASNNTNVTVNPTSLTFSATNYNTAQTVTVTMAANPLPNGNATLTLAATGGNYAGLTATVAVTANALPSFGTQTIADQTYPQGTAITTLNLPQATGGDGTLAYTLTPTPPAGLTFNATARTLTGTPTAPQAATEYTYTATDADGDTATLTFDIRITPTLTLGGVADANQAENTAYTGNATLTGTPVGNITWALTGDDANASGFTLSNQSNTGATVTLGAKDFEVPTDNDTNNIYVYTLTATDDDGNSDTVNVAITITNVDEAPAKPANLTAAPGDTEVTLTWTNPNDSTITKYQVRQAQGATIPATTAWADIANSTAATTTHTVDNLTNGTTYAFQIRAVVGTANGPDSDTVTATPRPDPAITVAPDTLVVDEGGSNTFDVTLVAAPTAAVAITVASNNTNVTVNPTSLTFSATNYNTAQTVTVTMAANPSPNGTATLTLAATGGNYAGLTATVAVTANALPSFGSARPLPTRPTRRVRRLPR